MKRILCVPNWSEGRRPDLLFSIREAIKNNDVVFHFAGSDFDHNRTVTAFSGNPEGIKKTLFELCEIILPGIDMQKHEGVHPRIGALDVCPFIILGDSMVLQEGIDFSKDCAKLFSEKYDVPVFLYEKSETGRHEKDLPHLRKGQYEGLLNRALEPDYGPSLVSKKYGASVFGVRDWLIAMNVNFATGDIHLVKNLAKEIRFLRDKDSRLTGVRALGLPLASRGIVQVSMNLTKPDAVSPDEIITWLEVNANEQGVEMSSTELIGVIRKQDIGKCKRLLISDEQIVDG